MAKKTFLAVACLIALSVVVLAVYGARPYPDGPFKTMLKVDGIYVPTNNVLVLSSSTVVVEHKSPTSYTKSPGLTTFDQLEVTTPSASARLDPWFAQGAAAPDKNIVVDYHDGSDVVLEAWMVYRATPASRAVQPDGSVKYVFNINTFERDRATVFPAKYIS